MAVRTTRIERRGLERERSTGINLRIEFEGAAEAEDVKVSEAFWGRNSVGVEDEEAACCASLRAFCRLRWGRRSSCVEVAEGARSAATGDVRASSRPIDPDPATVDVIAPLLPPARTFSSKAFGEKYPAHNRGVVATTVALTFAALENFLLVTDRLLVPIVSRVHDRHTVLKPLDRNAFAGAYRIIIACRCCAHKMWDHISRFSRTAAS